MRLASFIHDGHPDWGVIITDSTGGIASGYAVSLRDTEWTTLLSFIESGASTARLTDLCVSRPHVPIRSLRWLPPVASPTKIICVGVNYRSHAIEAQRAPDTPYPSFFVRFFESQAPHDEPIICPAVSSAFDFEGELAVVIGKRAKAVAAADATRHVFGLSCFGDHSVRDWQKHGTQATAGKNFRRSGSFGPWIETSITLDAVDTLTLRTRVNGVEHQRDMLGNMIFSAGQLIAYVSKFTDLEAGDVIVTGTPAGVGMTRVPPLWLREGDLVEVEIDGVGCLRNTVFQECTDAE